MLRVVLLPALLLPAAAFAGDGVPGRKPFFARSTAFMGPAAELCDGWARRVYARMLEERAAEITHDCARLSAKASVAVAFVPALMEYATQASLVVTCQPREDGENDPTSSTDPSALTCERLD